MTNGPIESEFGVAFAGEILPPERWARTALKRLPEDGPIDFVRLFGRDAPRALDIGCGNGRFLLSSAVRRPDWDHIGIDPLPVVVRYATRRANQRGLANCRVAVCDGHRFLAHCCPRGQLSEIHVYHPQPYALRKDRHRRLFDHTFILQIHNALGQGGRLYLQTDNAAYYQYLSIVLSSLMRWHEQVGSWPENPEGRTRREIVAINKGLNIYRGWAVRRDELDDQSFSELCQSLPQPNFDATQNRNPMKWRRPRD